MKKHLPIIMSLSLLIGVGALFHEKSVAQDTLQASLNVENQQAAVDSLRSYYFSRSYKIGVERGNTWNDRYPESAELHAWYIANLAEVHQHKKSREEANKLQKRHPKNPWSYFALSIAYNESHRNAKKSIPHSRRALKMAPNHPDMQWLRAHTLYEEVSKGKAIAFVDSINENSAIPPRLLTTKARAMADSATARGSKFNPELFKEAQSIFKKVREMNPQVFDAWYLAGYYHFRRHNYKKAEPLLAEAAKRSERPRIHQYYWRVIKGIDELSQKEKRARITHDIHKYKQRREPTAAMKLQFADEYGQLDMKEKKDSLQNVIVTEHPGSEAANFVYREWYERYWDKHEEALKNNDPEIVKTYRDTLRHFIHRPGRESKTAVGGAYIDLFRTYLGESNVPSDTALKLVEGMIKYDDNNHHISYGWGSRFLAKHTEQYERAREIARKGIVKARQEVKDNRRYYDSEQEYKKARNTLVAQMYDALGWVFFKEGKLDSAKKYLSKAYSLDNENHRNLLHLGRYYERKAKISEDDGYLSKAEDYYIQGMKTQGGERDPYLDPNNKESLKLLYKKRHGSLEGYQSYISRVKSDARKDRKRRILQDSVSKIKEIQPFELANLKGDTISSSEFEGEITVINMWGLWCGYCIDEMPDLQKLHEKYEDHAKVQMLTINNDQKISRVREWMKKKSYDFPVLRSQGYLKEAGVQVFPTTWFLNKDNELVYVKEGYTPKLVQEFSWRIEAMLK